MNEESRGSVTAFVGVEGGGKSLAMCAYALRAHARRAPVLTFPGWSIQDGREPDPEKRERWSTDMEPSDWLTIKHLPRGAVICIDEAQQWFDSALFGATAARLFGYVGTQRRKGNLTIYYTAQSWMQVHPRLRFPTHFVILCKDQYHDPAQRVEGRRRGEFINMLCWDVKGLVTGREWTYMGMTTLFAHHYWGYYDTEAVIDPAEAMIKVETRKKTYRYDANGDGGPRIYRPGEVVEDALGVCDQDAPPPYDEFIQAQSNDMDLLNRLAESGGANALQLAKLKRGLARGCR